MQRDGPGPHDTLIICLDSEHAERVRKAFGLNAHHSWYGDVLTGNRYDKIIAFAPPPTFSQIEADFNQQFLVEYLPTKLRFLGSGIIEV